MMKIKRAARRVGVVAPARPKCSGVGVLGLPSCALQIAATREQPPTSTGGLRR
jgi:hypothetical protein